MRGTAYGILMVVAAFGAAFITAEGDLTRSLENFVFVGLVILAWVGLIYGVLVFGAQIFDWVDRRWNR